MQWKKKKEKKEELPYEIKTLGKKKKKSDTTECLFLTKVLLSV